MRPTNISAATAATLLFSTVFAAHSFASDERKTRRTGANAGKARSARKSAGSAPKGKASLEMTLKECAEARQQARAIPSAISSRSAAATQP